MPDHIFALESSEYAAASAGIAGHYVAPVVTPPLSSSLGQLSLAIEARPVIIDQQELSAEERLQMYLTVARRSQHPTVMENAFTLALRTQRMIVASSLSGTMPTALKIKTCEIPLLKLFLEFGLRSADWRALVVRMLCDNVETGSGHLTVNRAKQVLKELAKKAGAKVLALELKAETAERRIAAVILLGWLKHERAIEPLVSAYDTADSTEKKLILDTLETHYRPKLAYHLKWQRQDKEVVAEPLLALLESA
ncbi:MAG: hypothetical protein JSS86_03965 [Cyanobacteria bacterium SZAS LIN-2]|nr:hypothetical protein [Cyanobacteria bacterium SZAS LIN-3]MBS1995437.1 hypothetical protein [Cyanobacteria bacterium SZAS LIN-2]